MTVLPASIKARQLGSILHWLIVASCSLVALALLVTGLNYGFLSPIGDNLLIRLGLWATMCSPILFAVVGVSSRVARHRLLVDMLAVGALAIYIIGLATAHA